MSRKTTTLLLAVLSTLTLLVLTHSNSLAASPPRRLNPANATLGFGTILAVSRPHSQRQASLLWAANLTSLSIRIPAQPAWTAADLRALHLDDASAISKGSAHAWLGHVHALEHFLASGKETALVIEDDVDWDIRLHVHQIPLLAAATQNLLSALESQGYWPHSNAWDVLHPGHCDDLVPSSNASIDPFHPLHNSHVLYRDTTLPAPALLHPDTSTFLTALRVSSGKRVLHRTFAPFCTFAYAVNQRSATVLLR
ncbi:hypothetical protein N0V95_005158, partial [Ascochyta clinopodiicola]